MQNHITFLIGIMSNKNSMLYKHSNIKLHLPEVKESGHGIVLPQAQPHNYDWRCHGNCTYG